MHPNVRISFRSIEASEAIHCLESTNYKKKLGNWAYKLNSPLNLLGG